ncbi:hypothetical protein H9N25_24155 [Pedobacter riviphilus]|uniref:Uncharacterized protein n=1 Tax=Pedobacter riviphilus TaxID=2766984 RepID=A0ABX6TK24_9SPHI|nr:MULTISPECIES: DUF2683 family protein [Pedobacter]NII85168.1 hypothetical protein [Pedobacter sp. SG908]NMN37924.1 hypothetical protein [Pedobacter sp. SG918]QNR84924.1 hypothetical protein H9N25_24155 [Pedobacter riviphilus]
MMETLIVQPKNKKQLLAVEAVLQALNVSFKKEKSYSPEFISEIAKGEDDVKNGRLTRVKDVQDIWKSIL